VLKIFLYIESYFYKLREILWNYPSFFYGEYSLLAFLNKIYKIFIPFSHFFVASLLSFFILIFSINRPLSALLDDRSSVTLIEGVVTGVNDSGQLNTISSINPIVSSNLQIERDVSELVYEPLLKVMYKTARKPTERFDQEYRLYLARDIVTVSTGAEYQIILRDDVYWHDGVKFSVDDVIATFDLVSKFALDSGASKALSQIVWEPVGNSVRICTKVRRESVSCSEQGEKPFFSNFLELISIKILPKHKITDINKNNFDSSIPELYRSPLGTGPYKFVGANEQMLVLALNENYYKKEFNPSIKKIQFKFFRTVEKAISALRSSEIHSFATSSIQYKKDLSNFKSINTNLSPVFFNQYWAIYLNLRKDPNGNPIGPKALLDEKVRQALSLAINRSEMIQVALENMGKPAAGSIPEISVFFNQSTNFLKYDVEEANKLLDQAGWTKFDSSKYRINDAGEELSFRLYYVDFYDRRLLANYIKRAFERIGVNLILVDEFQDGLTLQDLNNQYLTTGLFDTLLYGVTTFVDPDRYELFHSSQSKFPGLNLSGYTGKELSAIVGEVDGKKAVVNIPKIDKILQESRGLDPEQFYDLRKTRYMEFQELLSNDMPVIFLYHPQFVYFTNKKVQSVDLSGVTSLEGRFLNIDSIYITK
jgi:peptide/nickel transport system substrate-binding protein